MSPDESADGLPAAPPVPVPEGWTAERDGGTLTLITPDTCFWTFTAIPGGPDPADAVDSAVAGLRDEYEDFESEPLPAPPLVEGESGLDTAFFCLDSTVAARVRAFRDAGVTYVLFYQGVDREIEERRRELEALSRRAVRAVTGSSLTEMAGPGSDESGASSAPFKLPR
ncbi:hypothetical protein LzC2_00230 [Planctomycetes bacterium LzC2]|uniref:Uncharacterized protein n=2 Tax=Alienimonas chondri TaxID=2681879 RepID=A0ABX1V8Y9_9PLAN|nr:hypothetical protein [Alienimonas chondri]